MRAFTHALFVSHFTHVATATLTEPKSSPGLCVKSCESSLQSLRFVDVSPAASASQQACQSRLSLSSRYLCLGLNCGKETRDQALRQLNATCYDSLGSSIPSFKTDFTIEEIAGLRRVHKNDSFGSANPLHGVVVPSPQFFSVWFDTLVNMPSFWFAIVHKLTYSVPRMPLNMRVGIIISMGNSICV